MKVVKSSENITAGLPLMKNVLTHLAKSGLIQLG